MKIRVTTGGKSVAIDLEKKLGEKVFKAIVLQLLQADGMDQGQQSETLVKEQLPGIPVQIQPRARVKEKPEDSEEPSKKLGGAYTYKGFLYLKCPSCGHTRGFCTKKEIGGYHCELCGAYHPFTEELKQLQVNCQCGRKFEYMTNKEEKMFDINCIDCGGPVAVNYNEKKEIYETIR